MSYDIVIVEYIYDFMMTVLQATDRGYGTTHILFGRSVGDPVPALFIDPVVPVKG
jgi:hypothetical protein